MLEDSGAPAVLAPAPAAVMFADAGAPAVLAPAPDAVMRADAGTPTVVAPALSALMLADAGAPAVLALAPDAVMLADAGAPAVLALDPLAVMFADAGAPAALALAVALALDAVMLADASAPQSLHLLLWRLCSHFFRPLFRRPRAPARTTISLGPAAAGVTAPVKRTAGCVRFWPLSVLPPGSRIAHAGWKGPQGYWAQQRAGVRSTDSPHTGQSKRGAAGGGRRGCGHGILRHSHDR